jgi:hypothetical protein
MKINIRVLFILIIISQSFVKPQKNETQLLNKTLGVPTSTRFSINNISTLLNNNGISDAIGSNPSFYFPQNARTTTVFCSGLLWGAKVDSKILTGGSSYRSSLTPGRILTNGLAEDPNSSSARIYRVRRDYKEADLLPDAFDMGMPVLEQYEADWNEWPADLGAPFNDINNDKTYTPFIDIPGVPNADQTIWFVANDLDTAKTNKFYGTSPMGVEVQCTIWGYNRNDFLGNCLFKEYRLINKSKNTFKDMFIGVWSDVDIGGGSFDLPGCDSLLNLGYMYVGFVPNAQYGNTPPAVGFFLIKGPTVGKKNLNMTALGWIYKNSGLVYSDPDPNSYKGTVSLYYNLQGLLNDGTGHLLLMSMGKGTTKFPYSGDPVTGTGFIAGTEKLYDGGYASPSDHRIMVCSGPFNMAPGDTQTIKFAEIAAIGSDRLESVSLLKDYTRSIAKMYNIAIPVDVKKETTIPSSFSLSQNYPNPFNPSTTISYSIPVETPGSSRTSLQHVTLKVFDLLGREVATLVDEFKQAGNYQVQFSVKTGYIPSLPSGIYFYRLQAGDYSETKKMLLLK